MRNPPVLELIAEIEREMDGQAELVHLDDDKRDTSMEKRRASKGEKSLTPWMRLEAASAKRLSRRACRDNCPCRCHIEKIYRFPASLRPIIGDTFFSFIGQPAFIRRCSRRDCHAKIWAGDVLYIFPSWLLRKAIAVSVISCGFKRTIRLRDYNVVREFSDAVRCTFTGDLVRLQRLVANGLATPDDVTMDGWSLLHVSHTSCRDYDERWNLQSDRGRMQHIMDKCISWIFC
jgi:hypothetical protein